MKKLLGILAAASLAASSSALVVSCNSASSKKENIQVNDIINKVLAENIQNLDSLDEVNTKLSQFVNSKTIDGLTGLNAKLKDNSQTDIVVTITINTKKYNLVGNSAFVIAGAIKDKTKEDINSADVINFILAEGDINNLSSLDEVNNKLAKKASKTNGVVSLIADFNYQKNLFTSVVVSIEIDNSKYNLIGQPTFEIEKAIKKREVDINKAKELASNQIRNLNSLDQVKIALNKVMDYFNEVHDITFIESFTAEMNSGSQTDVKVTLNVNENNVELLNGDSFVLDGAIQLNKINILASDIQTSVSANIHDLENLKAVNKTLSDFVNSKTIDGLTGLTASLKTGSQTDVIVTIVIDSTNYNLVGKSTFEITGAIKDKTNNKKTIDREALVNEAILKINNLDDLNEVNNQLNLIMKNYEGVSIIKADYKYFLDIPGILKDPAAVHVKITIDENNYVLSGDKTFDIQNALATSRSTIYIDSSGKEKSTHDLNLTNLDVTEIKQIGFELIDNSWFEPWKIQAVHLPKKVQKVPTKISNQITSLKSMFENCEYFNQDISTWNTSNVTDMNNMFAYASSFNQDLNNWNTSKVTDMSHMFNSASSFNKNLNNWDVSKVTNMNSMFWGASKFNSNISTWNTSKVTDMNKMFYEAILFNQDISAWNTSKVTDMSYMFEVASSFNQDISAWNTSKVTDMNNMFAYASSFNQNINTREKGIWPLNWKSWDVSKVTDMNKMFYEASSFNKDISNWDTSNVTDMSNMFANATLFNQTLSKWDVSKVTNMSYMFKGAKKFNSNISNWDTSNVTDMSNMFNSASSFNQDLSNWNVLNVNSHTNFDWNTANNWKKPKPKFVG